MSWPGRARAAAISSANDLTGSLAGLTANAMLPVATSAIGVKSLSASYGMVRLSAGVIANVITVVISV